MFWLQTFLKTSDLFLHPQKKILKRQICRFSFWCVFSLQPPCTYYLRHFAVTRLQMLLLTSCLQEQLGVMIALLVVPTWLIFHCKSSMAHYCQVHAKNGRTRTADSPALCFSSAMVLWKTLSLWYPRGLAWSHTSSLSHWQHWFLCNSILVKTSEVLFQMGTNRD